MCKTNTVIQHSVCPGDFIIVSLLTILALCVFFLLYKINTLLILEGKCHTAASKYWITKSVRWKAKTH